MKKNDTETGRISPEKKWVLPLILLLAGAAVVLLSFSQYGKLPRRIRSSFYRDMTPPESSESLLTDLSADSAADSRVSFRTENSRMEGRKIIPEGADAQLLVSFKEPEGRILQTVELQFEEGFSGTTECCLYYPGPDGAFTETDKLVTRIAPGRTEVLFSLPEEADYRMPGLRIDIDAAYELKDLRISEQPVQGIYVLPDEPDKRAAAFLALVTAGLLALLYAFRDPVLRKAGSLLSREKRPADRKKAAAGKNREIRSGAGSAAQAEKRRRRYVFLTAAALCSCLWTVLFWHDSLLSAAGQARGRGYFLFFPVMLAGICLVILLYAFTARRYEGGAENTACSDLQKHFPLIILFLGLGYMFVLLPFSSPDELTHYLSAYRIADLFAGKLTPLGDPRLIMRTEDYLFTAARQKEILAGLAPSINTHAHLFIKEGGFRILEAPFSTNAVFCYIPAALGIAAARALHLGGELVFYAGRFANLLFFVLAGSRALKRQREYGQALFALMTLPMMLHLAASCSYDGITFSLVLLFCTQILDMAEKKDACTRKDLLVCMLCGALLAPAKTVYAVLLLLILLVPDRNLGKTKGAAVGKRLMVIASGLAAMWLTVRFTAWVSEGTSIHRILSESAGGHVVSWAGAEGYTFSWILHHPAGFLLMLARTVLREGDELFFTMLGSKLGRMDIPVPYGLCLMGFLLLLAGIFMQAGKRKSGDTDAGFRPSFAQRLLIILLCLIPAAGAAAAMLVSWTPVTENVISGLQGRYFLPLIPPLIWALRSRRISVSEELGRPMVLLGIQMNAGVLICAYSRQFF